MRGFVDLHCHWVAAIDDGARTAAEALAMLRGLHEAGFDTVVATPHMRPGMFDNNRLSIERAFASIRDMLPTLSRTPSSTGVNQTAALPSVHLASEHFFDDVVFGRLLRGEGLPYPRLPAQDDGRPAAAREDRQAAPAVAPSATSGTVAMRAVLVEFGSGGLPARAQHRFFDLRRAGLVPVLAHPERYEAVWRDDGCLDALLDAGAHLLLDLCALTGKYGRAPRRAAEKLIEEDAYEAACSDAHKPADIEQVVRAIERLEELVGDAEARRLLSDAPRNILQGTQGRHAAYEPRAAK